MAPMVATADEARWFAETARAAGVTTVGVMIEIPSAALAADGLLAAVDFASVGTNDLAQYAFAADRGSAGAGRHAGSVAPGAAPPGRDDGERRCVRRPAGRRLRRGGGRPGARAGAGRARHLSLSMAAGSIPAVRDQLGRVTLDECRQLGRLALAADGAAAARDAVHGALLEALTK